VSLPINQIICGDNCDVLGTLPRECIDLVVTSPPYDDLRTYGGHSWDFYGVAWQLKRVLKPGGVIVWVVADATKDGSETGTSMEQALHFKRLGLNLHDTMIWNKPPQGANGSELSYSQAMEFMFVLTNGRPRTVNRLKDRPNASAGVWYPKTVGGRNTKQGGDLTGEFGYHDEFGLRTNVWPLIKESNGNPHPAPFPEALARDHILSWSNEGDVVLDPFNGSGTTTKMARELGRQYIGIEVNPDYCVDAESRIDQKLLEFSA
jgi:DNA modification methylase